MTLPIRARLTAWYVATMAIIVVLLGTFLILRLHADLVHGVDRTLAVRAEQIALGLQGRGEGEFRDVSGASLVGLPRGESAAQLLSASGAVLETSGDPVAARPLLSADALARTERGGRLVQTAALGADREPFRELAIRQLRGAQPGVIVVATSLEDVNGSVSRLLTLLFIAGPLALAVAAAGGWLIARRALAPVARMTDQAGAIGADRLNGRVDVPSTTDEIGRLGRTLNEMLDRVERGVEEHRRFVSDASHELRTPLAIMRAELEVGQRTPGITPEAASTLQSSLDEVDRMTRVVDNLMTMARIDEAGIRLQRVTVRLDDVAEAAALQLRPLAAAGGVTLEVAADAATVLGDREGLLQVVRNVLENAIKHTPPGGAVRVRAERVDGGVGLRVNDAGPGIDPGLLPRVFDRFVHTHARGTRGPAGTGLGLAIARAIVEAHGGAIWAENPEGGGASVHIRLPVIRSRTAGAAGAGRPGSSSGAATGPGGSVPG